MGRKSTLTEADYLAVVTAFEQVGGKNVSAVVRLTKRSRELLDELWSKGKPELGMAPISQRLAFSPTYSPAPAAAVSPVVTQSETQKAPSGGPGPTIVGESRSSPSPGVDLTPTSGLSAKQQAARSREEDAILSMVQNLIGSSVTLTILTKVINEQAGLLEKITDNTEKRALLKELGALMAQTAKVTAVLTDGIPRVMAAGRLNTGQAGAITEHRHTGTVDVQHTDTDAAEAEERHLAHMLDIHARARAYVPGTYVGEEAGIIDAEVTTVGGEPDLGDLGRPVALASLREGANLSEARGASRAEAEQRLRLALAERGMPATQIDRVVDRAKARCEQAARELSTIVDEVLATAPGQAAN